MWTFKNFISSRSKIHCRHFQNIRCYHSKNEVGDMSDDLDGDHNVRDVRGVRGVHDVQSILHDVCEVLLLSGFAYEITLKWAFFEWIFNHCGDVIFCVIHVRVSSQLGSSVLVEDLSPFLRAIHSTFSDISYLSERGGEADRRKKQMWCVYLPFGLLLSALETIFFWYFLILDHLLIDDIFKVATRIKIKAGFRKNRFL